MAISQPWRIGRERLTAEEIEEQAQHLDQQGISRLLQGIHNTNTPPAEAGVEIHGTSPGGGIALQHWKRIHPTEHGILDETAHRGTHNSAIGGQWKFVVNFTILARYCLRRHTAALQLGS